MKKRFLFILPFLFLTVVSCGLKDLIGTEPGSVSFQLGNKVTSQLARNIFADTTTDKTVDITVTISGDYDAEETQNIDLATTDTILFTFDNIPGGSTVTIDIVVTRSSDKAEMYKGSAEGVKIEAGKITPVSVTLKPVAKVEELIPTIEILLGEKAEVQASLSLLEILGEYFLPSDTKAEKYNYYSNLYEDEAFIEDKDLKFRVDNWDAAYKVTLNDTELKVDDKNYIAYADVLAAAVTGTNSIKVTKDEKSSEAGKFDVVCGIYDVKPLVVVGTGEDSFWLEDGEKDIRLGVDANNGVEPVVFYSFDPYVREVTSAEEAAKALFSGKFNIKYSVTVSGEAAEVKETKQKVETYFGEYEFTCNTALIPAKAKKNVVLKAVFEIPEAYLEKDASGKATEVSTTASFVTSYDVTSKGSVYLEELNGYLYYFKGNTVSSDFEGYGGEDSQYYVSGNVRDYCFDEYGNVIFARMNDGIEINVYDGETTYSGDLSEVYTKVLAYDYDNSTLYGIGEEGVFVKYSKENNKYTPVITVNIDDFFELAEKEITTFTVNDNFVYIAVIDYSNNTSVPAIYKFSITEVDKSIKLTYVSSFTDFVKTITGSTDWRDYTNIEITDLEILNGDVYAIVNQQGAYVKNTYVNDEIVYSDTIVASRGCLLKTDLDFNYSQVTGWEKGNNLSISMPIYGFGDGNENFEGATFNANETKEGCDRMPLYEERYGVFDDDGYSTWEPRNQMYVTASHVFYTATKENYKTSQNFIAPKRFIGIKPKSLLIKEDGCFVYVDDSYYSYKFITSISYVNLETFAFGVSERQVVGPGSGEPFDVSIIDTVTCDLRDRSFVYYSNCGDVWHEKSNWDGDPIVGDINLVMDSSGSID